MIYRMYRKKMGQANYVSMDFGLVEFGELSPSERLRRYRQYLYDSGIIGTKEFGGR